MCEYFVGKNLAKDFNSNSGFNSNLHVHYLSSRNTNTFYLTPVTNSEIFNIIIHTNNKNSRILILQIFII